MNRFLIILLSTAAIASAQNEAVTVNTKTKNIVNPLVIFPSGKTLECDGCTLIGFGAGSGNVSNVGTPLLDQVAVWTDTTHIKGVTTIKGGTTGQALVKDSGTDYDYSWHSVSVPTPTATSTATPTATATATATPTATATATPTATAVTLTIDGVSQQINTDRTWSENNSVTFVVDAGGVLTTGTKNPIKITSGGTLQGWAMMCKPSGSVTADIFRSADAAGLPTVSIVGPGTKPAISSGVEAHSTSFTSWTSTTLTANDNLAISLSGISTSTYVVLTLYYK